MPFVPPVLLETCVFLYPSEDAAAAGERWGGSGFLAGTKANNELAHLYAVTNAHVVAGGATVVRIRRPDGSHEVQDGGKRWELHRDGDDVAVLYLGLRPDREYFYIDREMFLGQADLRRQGIGPGDSCLMVGRFTRPTGQQFDRPVLRFGNIAMTPEPIYQNARAFWQDSFLVDMRSLSGFSGSAVLVYYGSYGPRRLPGDQPEPVPYHQWTQELGDILGDAWLLGIDWGHIKLSLDMYAPGADINDPDNEPTGKVEANSGMAGVVPAWKIAEVLDLPEMDDARNAAEQEKASEESGAELDAELPPESIGKTKDLMASLLQIPKDEAREG